MVFGIDLHGDDIVLARFHVVGYVEGKGRIRAFVRTGLGPVDVDRGDLRNGLELKQKPPARIRRWRGEMAAVPRYDFKCVPGLIHMFNNDIGMGYANLGKRSFAGRGRRIGRVIIRNEEPPCVKVDVYPIGILRRIRGGARRGQGA